MALVRTHAHDDPKSKNFKIDKSDEDNSGNNPDFVLVYKISKLSLKGAALIEGFLRNLTDSGIRCDTSRFSMNRDTVFVTLYAPTRILYDCSEAYFIELACNNADFKPPVTKPYWRFMRNELNCPEFNGVVHQRAPKFLDVTKPTTMTKSERILILYTFLSKVRFGKGQYDFGIEKLISKGVFECAYPLHDGTHHWTEKGPLNERQLLKKYWSSLDCYNKQQPLDVIYHYFGSQAAFYFAFMGFYNKMLIPAGICGFVFFILGLFLFENRYMDTIIEICFSKWVMCPKCLAKNCRYEDLRDSCFNVTLTHAFDNTMTFSFAILMSIWAAVFMRLWQKEETILMFKWDLRSLEIDDSSRDSYIEKATKSRFSRVTGEVEPCVSKKTQCGCYVLTTLIMLVAISVIAVCHIAVMIVAYQSSLAMIRFAKVDFFREHASTICSLLGIGVSTCLVKVIGLGYHRITVWLTNIENPRTQITFDNSYIYKLYILASINNYTTILYSALFKGKFFTYPGDKQIYKTFFGLGADVCDPPSCVLHVVMFMMISLMFKWTFWTNLIKLSQIIIHKIGSCTKTKRKTNEDAQKLENNQWEADYMLKPVGKLNILEEYLELAIQYGFVTFFVAFFPLAPAVALLNNLITLRLDAGRKIIDNRRTVPFKIIGMGAWNGIFQAATFVGVLNNALMIALASDFISKEIHSNFVQSFKGYIGYSLSVFNTSDFGDVGFDWKTQPTCFYSGYRHTPTHPKKYQPDHRETLTFVSALLFIITFEHILLFLTALISYCISTTPYQIQQLISIQEQHYKELRALSTKPTKPDRSTAAAARQNLEQRLSL